jgi:hypothetical protein
VEPDCGATVMVRQDESAKHTIAVGPRQMRTGKLVWRARTVKTGLQPIVEETSRQRRWRIRRTAITSLSRFAGTLMGGFSAAAGHMRASNADAVQRAIRFSTLATAFTTAGWKRTLGAARPAIFVVGLGEQETVVVNKWLVVDLAADIKLAGGAHDENACGSRHVVGQVRSAIDIENCHTGKEFEIGLRVDRRTLFDEVLGVFNHICNIATPEVLFGMGIAAGVYRGLNGGALGIGVHRFDKQ